MLDGLAKQHWLLSPVPSARRLRGSLLLSLLHLLVSRIENLPDIVLSRDPLLYFGVQLAQLLLLDVCLFKKSLFALLQCLSLVFQLLSCGVLVLDSRDGQVVLVAVCVLGMRGQEFLGCGERQAVEDVAVVAVLALLLPRLCALRSGNSLIILAPSNLAAQMALLVVQILQLQVQRINLLLRFAGLLLGAAYAEDSFAV